MVAGKTAEAIARLRNMFAEDKNAEYTVVGAFAFHFRRMYHATVLLEKGTSTSEVAKRLRIWANIEGFFEQVRKITLPQLSRILSQLGTIDYAIKTGQTKAQVAIEQLVLDMALG
jgi:DNA polymerase III delta subunit